MKFHTNPIELARYLLHERRKPRERIVPPLVTLFFLARLRQSVLQFRGVNGY